MATLEVHTGDRGREYFELGADETLLGRDPSQKTRVYCHLYRDAS